MRKIEQELAFKIS